MNIRSTVILCIIAVLGVAAAIAVHRADPAGQARSRSPFRPLFASGVVPAEVIDCITLRRAGEPAYVFARSGDRWRQTEPFDHPMDAYSIQQLADLATALNVVEVLDEDVLSGSPGSEAAMGLDPPRATIALAWPRGTVELKLGRLGIAGRAYLKVSGYEKVYVVNQDLHDRALRMDPKEWRDRRIFHNVGVDSDRIEIAVGDSATILQRDRKQWRMIEPARTRVNDLALDELFQALGRAVIGSFILDQVGDLSRFGLTNPMASLSITTTRLIEIDGEVARQPQTQRLLVGARIGVGSQDRFAIVEGRPVIVRLSEAVLAALFRPAGQLVSPAASGVEPADVKSIRISGPGGDIVIERDLDLWIAPGFDQQQVPNEIVDELLKTLTQLRAVEVELREYPRDLQVATITLFGYGKEPLDTVRIAREPGADGEPGRWAMENGDNVLRIHEPSLHINLTPEDFGLPEMP